jgi:uncharacterized protein (DUF2062 family)
MIGSQNQKLRKYVQDILRIKTSPHSIALGFAVGTLISILPTPGFNILLGLLVMLFVKRISKITLFGSMAFWNPLTLLPVYWASYRIGDMFFGSVPIVRYDVVILDQIYNFSRRFLVGNVLLALVISGSAYIVILLIAHWYGRRKG